MAFRAPTFRNATDLQWGQRAGNIVNWRAFLTANLSVRFRRRSRRRRPPTSEWRPGAWNVRSTQPGFIGAACLACGFDLFRRPHVRLRQFYVLFCAGHLTFVPFR